jgi:hypothetical protein
MMKTFASSRKDTGSRPQHFFLGREDYVTILTAVELATLGSKYKSIEDALLTVCVEVLTQAIDTPEDMPVVESIPGVYRYDQHYKIEIVPTNAEWGVIMKTCNVMCDHWGPNSFGELIAYLCREWVRLVGRRSYLEEQLTKEAVVCQLK